jgi:hypothetical protein
MLAKSFAFLGCGDTVGVLIGAKRPVVLTSRADSTAYTSFPRNTVSSERRSQTL